MNDIEQRVKRVIRENLGIAEADITNESRIVEDLGADSLDKVELIMWLEDEFDIDIPDIEAVDIKTVQQAIDYITGKVPA